MVGKGYTLNKYIRVKLGSTENVRLALFIFFSLNSCRYLNWQYS